MSWHSKVIAQTDTQTDRHTCNMKTDTSKQTDNMKTDRQCENIAFPHMQVGSPHSECYQKTKVFFCTFFHSGVFFPGKVFLVLFFNQNVFFNNDGKNYCLYCNLSQFLYSSNFFASLHSAY